MKLIKAYTTLRQLKLSIFQTKDVAGIFNISTNNANKILSRISEANQIVHLKRGTWAFPDLEPLTLPSILTAPFPAYVSLQTALYFHGMISQIPDTIYAVSIARTHLYKTQIANVSIHHIQPSFFFGYEVDQKNALLKIATPEKAIIDIFYLSQTKTKLFQSLPEVELPKNFRISVAKKIIESIKSPRKKTLIKQQFDKLIANHYR